MKLPYIRIVKLVFFILSVVELRSQPEKNDFLEDRIQSTVQLRVGSSYGSGIITRDSFSLYLITARHNFFDENLNMISNTGYIKIHPEDFRTNSISELILDIPSLLASHKMIFDTISDVCVTKLATFEIADKKLSGAIAYTKGVIKNGKQFKMTFGYVDESYFVAKEDIHLGESVFTIGFPISLGLQETPQFDNEKPLLKRCSISSLSKKYDNFIIDCQVYGGNSGGPVFLERSDNTFYTIKLIGIIIQYVPFYKKTIKSQDIYDQTSSYAVVVPIKKAIELMKECN